MSGTRKMEKFEIDAFTKVHADERQAAEEKKEATPPSGKAEQAEKDAAAAIAGLEPATALDRLTPAPAAIASAQSPPSQSEGVTDLPARPFEPRQDVPESGPVRAAAVAGPSSGAAGAAQVHQVHQSQIATPAEGAWVPGEWVPPQAAGDEAPPSSSRQAAAAAAATPEDADALRTRLARKFITLADSVGEAFKEFAIGAGAWAVELTAPQGMSTGGGKQALQHIRLRPRRDGYTALVAGTVNQVERRAELRDYDHVAILHEVRFRHSLEISNQEWEQFLRKAEVVLNNAGIQSMRTPPPRDLLEQRRNMQRVSKGAVAALVVVLVLAALVVWRVAAALMASSSS